MAKKVLTKLWQPRSRLHPQKDPKIPSPLKNNNTVFVHIPKAAGSTINIALFGYRIGHRTIESYWNADPQFTETAFKFAFVRHPYFRFVSAYDFLVKGGMSSRDASYAQRYPEAFDSLESLAEACECPSFRNSIVHLRDQYKFVSVPSTGHYRVYMDYVAKTEFLNEHIDLLQTLVPNTLSRRLGLAKDVKMNSGHQKRLEINHEVFNKIRKIYQDDFEFFGYDEWGDPEKAKQIGF